MKLTKKMIKEAIKDSLSEAGYDAAGNKYVFVIMGYGPRSEHIDEIVVTPSYNKMNEIKNEMRSSGLEVEVEEAVFES